MRPKRIAVGQRFGLEGVQNGAGQPPAVQRSHNVRLHHQFAAGGVDEECSGLQLRQQACVHQASRLVGCRQQANQHIDLRQQSRQTIVAMHNLEAFGRSRSARPCQQPVADRA